MARSVPAEEDDNDSVVSVASSGVPATKPGGDTDSDASQPGEGNNSAPVVDQVTDEDESDEESEEDFKLSGTLFADADTVQSVFENFINLPDSWPLMRIMIPLDGLSLQVERIISCVAAELVATHHYPDTQNKFVKRIAKKLTAILACYLAGEVASMVSPMAAVEHKEMVAPMYQPLLTPVYWVRPICTELLHLFFSTKKGHQN